MALPHFDISLQYFGIDNNGYKFTGYTSFQHNRSKIILPFNFCVFNRKNCTALKSVFTMNEYFITEANITLLQK